MKYLPLALTACVLLAARASRADEPGQPSRAKTQSSPSAPLKVPFELLKTQHMVVNIKVNGKGPYRVIFDTGAPTSLLSNKVMREAKLKPSRNFKQPTLPIFGARGLYELETLEIGEVKAEKLSTMVMDHPTVVAISSVVGPIEGILGFTFFARYRTTIDYEKKVMTLEPTTFQPPDAMQALMKKMLAPKSVREAASILAPAALLGVRVAKAEGDENPGVTIEEVWKDSPAAQAGLRKGDRLLTLGRRWTDSIADCYVAASRLRPGVEAEATVLRNGQRVQLKLRPRPGL